MRKIGVLALQGNFQKHIESLTAYPKDSLAPIQIRTIEDLSPIERLIIPGGESTTVSLLLKRTGLDLAIQERAKEGMPIWGTCMGMILLASQIEQQQSKLQVTPLGLIEMTVQRNAFGSQIHSFEDQIFFQPLQVNLLGVFIRAPIIKQIHESVEVLAKYQEKIVAVKQKKIIATAFHPELTEDSQLLEWFLSL